LNASCHTSKSSGSIVLYIVSESSGSGAAGNRKKYDAKPAISISTPIPIIVLLLGNRFH